MPRSRSPHRDRRRVRHSSPDGRAHSAGPNSLCARCGLRGHVGAHCPDVDTPLNDRRRPHRSVSPPPTSIGTTPKAPPPTRSGRLRVAAQDVSDRCGSHGRARSDHSARYAGQHLLPPADIGAMVAEAVAKAMGSPPSGIQRHFPPPPPLPPPPHLPSGSAGSLHGAVPGISPIARARAAINELSNQDLQTLLFEGDVVSDKLLQSAYACPPHLKPDLDKNDPEFMSARAACNAEMMRHCAALCTPKTRRSHAENPGSYVPYIMAQQARKNLQKIVPHVPFEADTFNFGVFLAWLQVDSPYRQSEGQMALGNMVGKVAEKFADEGQAQLEHRNVENDPPPPSAPTIRTFARTMPRPQAKAGAQLAAAHRRSHQGPALATALTLAEIKAFKFEKLHTRSSEKSIEWALDEVGFDDEADSPVKDRYEAFRIALTEILKPPGKKVGRSRSGNPTSAVLSAFKAHCKNLGIKFDERRLTDLVDLLAVLQARCA